MRGARYTDDVIKTWGEVETPMDMMSYGAWGVAQGVAQIPAAVVTFGASAFILEMGEIYGGSLRIIAEEKGISIADVINQNLDDPGTAMVYAGAAAAFERLGAGTVMRSFTKKALQKRIKESVGVQVDQTSDTC